MIEKKLFLSEIGMKKRLVRVLTLVFAVLMAAVIFFFSAQNGEISGDSSDKLSEKILSLFGAFEEADTVAMEMVMTVGSVLRKVAHFTEYFVFGAVVCGFFATFSWKKRWTGAISFAIGALYAVSDELHQYFVPGRCASVWDVLLDSAGVLCGVLAVIGVTVLLTRREEKKAK